MISKGVQKVAKNKQPIEVIADAVSGYTPNRSEVSPLYLLLLVCSLVYFSFVIFRLKVLVQPWH